MTTNEEVKTPNYDGPTPETDAFMALIDDSEVDMGQIRAKLATFERELIAANERASETNRLHCELEAIQTHIRAGLTDEQIGGAPPAECVALLVSQRDNAYAGIGQLEKERDQAVRFATKCEQRDEKFEILFMEEFRKLALHIADEKQKEEGISDTVKRIIGQRDAALALARELGADKDRLDWLEETAGGDPAGLNIGGICYWSVIKGNKRLGEGDDLREAIDAAIKERP